MIRYLQVAGDRAAEIPTTFRTAPCKAPTLLKFWEPLQLGHSLPRARRNRHPVSSDLWSLRDALLQFACAQVLERPTPKGMAADKGDGARAGRRRTPMWRATHSMHGLPRIGPPAKCPRTH